jgi:hypothetical protein
MTEEQMGTAEPTPDSPTEEPAAESANSRAREWLSQLETMIQNVAREAAPVARDVGAKAAELAAVAAVKAGPIAHKAAEATTEYGQRFADKAQSVAADWRHENEAAKAAEAEPPKELPEPVGQA